MSRKLFSLILCLVLVLNFGVPPGSVQAQGEVPTLYAEIGFDWVDGRNWPLETEVTLTIEDPNTPLSPDYTAKGIVGTDQPPTYVRFDVWEDGFDLQPGHIVTLTDGTTTRIHTALDIGISNVNLTSNYVDGFAPASGSLNVLAHDPCWENVSVSADITGYWIANFVCDLNTVAYISAEMQGSDDIGVSTGFFWSPPPPPPPPTLYAETNFEWVDGWNWPNGDTIALTIKESEGGDPIFYDESIVGTYEPNWPNYVRFDVGEYGFDVWPDLIVSLKDLDTGVTKTHTVLKIGITEVDLDNNIVTGYALRDTSLTVTAHTPCWENVEVSANGADYVDEGYAYWQADFNGLCELHTVEFIHADQPGTEEEGVSTGYFWSPPVPLNVGLWWSEAMAFSYDEIVLRTGWGACTPGLVTAFQKAVHIDITIDGVPLYPEGDEALYWNPIEPMELEGCQVAPAGNQASVSRWRYSLGSLEPGIYEIYVHYWLDHPVIDGLDGDEDGKLDKYDGTIIENTIMLFVLDETITISGTVFETNGETRIPNVHVDACSTDDTFCNGAETNQLGEYSIGLLPDKEYRVFVWGQPGWASEVYQETIWWHEATLVSPGATGIDFTLEPGGTISGVVTDGEGNPLANIGVDIMDGGYGACTDENGYYSIVGLPFGTYDIAAGRDFCGPHPYSEQVMLSITIDEDNPDIGGIDIELGIGGSISGTATAVGGGLIGDNIDVEACLEDGSYCKWTSVQSDGSYQIIGLPTGVYRLQAYQYPEGNWVQEIFDNTHDWDAYTPVFVTAGQDTPDINFTLELGGSISGTVTEQGTDNEPVVDMEVAACPYDFDSGEYLEGMPCYSGWTETDGSYFIRGVPAGTYIVDSGWWGNWVPEIYSEQVDYGLADPVVVVADENTPDINFTLERGSSISGTVTEQGTGAPIEGMVVDVCDYETGWDTCFHGWTEADGTYFISGIPTGTYRMFSGWDDSNWMVEYYNEQAAWELATPVDVEANTELSGINFTLEMGGSISGVVTEQDTGAPIEGVVVDICDYETGFDGPCYGGFTEADGSYFIAGIQPGTYRVFSGWDHTNWVVEYYNEQADWELAELVEIEANTDLYEIDFTLELGGSISGTVTEQGAGAPIEGKMVEACDYVAGWDGPCFRDWTRADGSYFIPGVPAGIYRVSSSWEGTWMVEYYNEQADWELADPVEVTVNRDTPNINFSLEMSE